MAHRICWHCDVSAHMTPLGNALLVKAGDCWSRPFACDHCGHMSVGILRAAAFGTAVDAHRGFDTSSTAIAWQPLHMLGRRFDDVPDPIADAASEAFACYSIRSYRAAALLARAVTEAVAKEQDITGGNLKAKIDALEAKRVISPLIAQTAHEIRFVGNDMAHGDFVNDIGEEECDDLLNFMSSLLEEVYQRPTNLSRFRDQRQRRATASNDPQHHHP